MWKSFAKTVLTLRELLAELGGWLLALMAFLIFIDVIARYFFDSPLPAIYELSEEVLMVGFVFLAISASHHIDITLLVSRYKGGLKRTTAVVRHLLSFIFLSLATWQSAVMTVTSWNQGEVSTSLLGYPLYPARATLIVGFGLLSLVELVGLVEALGKGREE